MLLLSWYLSPALVPLLASDLLRVLFSRAVTEPLRLKLSLLDSCLPRVMLLSQLVTSLLLVTLKV